MARVLLVHWKPEEAGPHVAALREAGHDVRVLAPDVMPSLRALAADRPGAIVVDLGRLPSRGRAVGTALRQQKATRDVPLLSINQFFDRILVMDKREDVKQNRFSLLKEVWDTASAIADFSKLQVG